MLLHLFIHVVVELYSLLNFTFNFESYYLLNARPLLYTVCRYFLLICVFSIHSLNRILHRGKVILMKYNLSDFSFMDQAFGIKSKSSLLNPKFVLFFFPKRIS